MNILLAGATGALGTALTKGLQARGHHVLGLTRQPARVKQLAAQGVQPIVANALDREGLLRAVDGLQADAVIHELTALQKAPLRPRDMDMTNRLRTEGTANLLAAAQQLGAHRFVTQSMIFGYGFADYGDRVVSEEDEFGRSGQGKFQPTVDALEAAEQQAFSADGIEGVALRYGLLYGDDVSTMAVVDMLRKRRLPAPKGGGGVRSWVWIEDAAAATIAALERGRAGQAYNVVDDQPVSWGELLRTLAAAFGAPAPRELPGWLLRPMPYLHAVMTRSMRVSNRKAREELGWQPTAPSIHEGFARIAAPANLAA